MRRGDSTPMARTPPARGAREAFRDFRHAFRRRIGRILHIPPENRLHVEKDLFYRYARLRLPQDAVYVEIGAATGRSAAVWTQFLGLAPGRCHLVEACPVNSAILREKLPGYRVHHYAVSDRDGSIPLYVIDKPTDEGSSRSNTTDLRVLRSKSKLPVREVMVPAITMNRLFDEAGIDRCDLLYMNCEGAEYDILAGDVSFLDRVLIFSLDLHKGLFGGARTEDQMVRKRIAIFDLLESRGFVRIGGHQRKHLGNVTAIHISSFWERRA